MTAKKWVALGLFVCLMFLWVVSEVINTSDLVESPATDMWSSFAMGQNWQSSIYRQGFGGNIAMIKIEGTMIDTDTGSYSTASGYDQKAVKDMITKAFEREDIKAVLFYIDSPGGGTYEADELYNLIKGLKEKYPGKPLIVYMGSMATSAAYYISVPADMIYASRNTLTGSIGVILSSYTATELANKIGVKDLTFKSGEYKDILNPLREPTEPEKAIVQAMVMESYGFFVDAVAEGRGMERNQVLQLADGRFYTATQAKQNGLIDELGSLDDAIDAAADKAGIENPNVLEFKTSPANPFGSIFSSMIPGMGWLNWEQGLDVTSRNNYPRMLYMPGW